MAYAEIGVIGVSGLYSLPGLEKAEEVSVETPWGAPSDACVLGALRLGCIKIMLRYI